MNGTDDEHIVFLLSSPFPNYSYSDYLTHHGGAGLQVRADFFTTASPAPLSGSQERFACIEQYVVNNNTPSNSRPGK